MEGDLSDGEQSMDVDMEEVEAGPSGVGVRVDDDDVGDDDDVDVGDEVGDDVDVGDDADVGGDSDEDIGAPMMPSSLLNVMSPKTKRKVFRRLSQKQDYTKVKRQMRKEGHRINLRETNKVLDWESEARTSLKRNVEAFLNEDSNSIPCPEKKKVEVRYCALCTRSS